MLLAIDIGNSAIKFGIYDGDILKTRFSIPTRHGISASGFKAAVDGRLDHSLSSAIVCSVVPELESPLKEYLENDLKIDTAIVKNDLDFGFTIHYQPLEAAGTDRIVNCFAAAEKYGVPCIVCSFGTATTIDVVNESREMLGGLITIGMSTSAKALHQYTANLPDVEIRVPENVINWTTLGSIQAGIFYTQIGMVEGSVWRLKKEIGDKAQVIATGGFASMIAEKTLAIDVVDENLLLDGLHLLSDR